MSKSEKRRDCAECWRYLPPGTKAANGDGPFFTGCCTSPRVVGNRPWGYVAVSIARAWDSPCGPDGNGWRAA